MSKIDDQIKELLRKKKKTELYGHILNSLSEFSDPEFEEVKSDVLLEVTAFVDAQVDMIENSKKFQETGDTHPDDENFTLEEIKILKQTVKKLLTPKAPANDGTYQSSEQAPTQKKQAPPEQRQDKISFALSHRHLANKRVRCNTSNGEVLGTVVGLDAPHIIVRTDTGHTAPMPLETLEVING